MFRLYIERKQDFCTEAKRIFSEITGFLGIDTVTGVRYLNRYDIENVSDDVCKKAADRIFSEPQSDLCYVGNFPLKETETVIAWELLPGQYDQRADSAAQCLSLLQANDDARVRCAKLVVLEGAGSTGITLEQLEKIRRYLINPVEAREASAEVPSTLKMKTDIPADIPVQSGFNSYSKDELGAYLKTKGLAMDLDDLVFLQDYFKSVNRDPTETEIRVLDTYWSDHCRHTTFTTRLESIEIEDGAYKALFEKSLKNYTDMRTDVYSTKEKPITLMDMAVIGAKYLKKHGKLDDIELSDEINACSIFIDVHCTNVQADGTKAETVEKWLLMFKNETHNHPTEIEPFGGAATCIGGAIRDPLSGRSWVYQSMRITGAGNPLKALSETRKGKLPQMKLTREAADGFSSYGNQIGLTTGLVHEVYHDGFEAKRMELGAVIAAAPAKNVKREEPEKGDVVILVGGGTGRDGIGGATGSSKVHTVESVVTAAAEVQKGNAVEERKIQRLFRNADVASIIRRCNDFGAGGVAVAVGELSPGLNINLDAVPKKYEGLNGTELAISESQERMAVVVRKTDAETFIAAAEAENLSACIIAEVTDTNRLVMTWRGKTIVDIDRSFLDAAGAPKKSSALITSPDVTACPLVKPLPAVEAVFDSFAKSGASSNDSTTNAAANEADRAALVERAWVTNLKDLSCCSQRGLKERFDGSIGASSVLFPFGGTYQGTPEAGMVAKIPVYDSREADCVKETATASVMTFGYDADIASWSPWHGAQIAVLDSLAKMAALGGDAEKARLTFQEYFERTTSREAWGKPAAALLGALDAQRAMGTASIGGKDSMSGTYQDIHVPPTLVSFAVGVTDTKNATSGAFKAANGYVYLVPQPYGADAAPDFVAFTQNARALAAVRESGVLRAAYTVGAGGIAAAVSKMSFGNRIGFAMKQEHIDAVNAWCARLPNFAAADSAQDFNLRALFLPLYGSLIIETETPLDLATGTNGKKDWICIGRTQVHAELDIAGVRFALAKTAALWEEPLNTVFPHVSGEEPAACQNTDETDAEAILSGEAESTAVGADGTNQKTLPAFATQPIDEAFALGKKSATVTKAADAASSATNAHFEQSRAAKPKVLLPVFPGTNCEYDMERAFRLAGAQTELFVFRNKTQQQLDDSLAEFTKKLSGAQILALSGGFSVGDEPDGSGKFIANVLRSPAVADEVMSLLETRKGLVLGICNGFQALIKVGLVPYGKIMSPSEEMPTLTYNTVHRLISRVVKTRVVSARSPWAQHESIYENPFHYIPISHGEGRVIVSEQIARDLFKNGQVFTQYVDAHGEPTMIEPDNPNGSMYAIEGLTSPDGRVLGKMAHNERTIGLGNNGESSDLLKNIGGNKCQNIFAAGVAYFG